MNTDMIITVLLSFVTSMKWVSLIAVILGYKLINQYLEYLYSKNELENDKLIKEITITDEPMKILDGIIGDVLDEYTILFLKPKDIVYINNAEEDKIRNYVVEKVTERISMILVKKISYMYDSEYISDIIANRIYFAVVDFVLTTNAQSE